MEVPSREIRDAGPVLIEGLNSDPAKAPIMDIQVVDYDFVSLLGLHLVAGNNLRHPADAPPLPSAEPTRRTTAFDVAPSVAIAERASTRTTVVEVNARDRPALLAALTAAIHQCGDTIHSAHIATYGERAVDVFYVTAPGGTKLNGDEIDELRARLLDAAREPSTAKAT
jgi:UTP:GlnB (protein PII) uridylyltransferase